MSDSLYVYTAYSTGRRGRAGQAFVDWRYCEKHWTESGSDFFNSDRGKKALKKVDVEDAREHCDDCREETQQRLTVVTKPVNELLPAGLIQALRDKGVTESAISSITYREAEQLVATEQSVRDRDEQYVELLRRLGGHCGRD